MNKNYLSATGIEKTQQSKSEQKIFCSHFNYQIVISVLFNEDKLKLLERMAAKKNFLLLNIIFIKSMIQQFKSNYKTKLRMLDMSESSRNISNNQRNKANNLESD